LYLKQTNIIESTINIELQRIGYFLPWKIIKV